MAPWITRLYRKGSEIRTFPIQPKLKVNDGSALLQAAQKGMGIALTPRFGVKESLADGSLVEVMATLDLKHFSPIYLMYPSRSHLPKKTRLFIDRMVAYADKLYI